MSADVRRAKLRAAAAYLGAAAERGSAAWIANTTPRQAAQDATDYAERQWPSYMEDDDGTD